MTLTLTFGILLKKNLGHKVGNKRDMTETCSALKKENQFLRHLRIIAAHRDRFVRCRSVCLSGSHTLLGVMHIYVRRRLCIPRNAATIKFFFYIYCFETHHTKRHMIFCSEMIFSPLCVCYGLFYLSVDDVMSLSLLEGY